MAGQVVVGLKANGEKEGILYRGEPLTFTVTIANLGSDSVRFGSEGKPWHSLFTLELEKEGTWVAFPWVTKLFSNRPPEPVAALGGGVSAIAELDLTPEQTSDIPVGDIRVKCSFEAGEGTILESKEVKVSVKARRKPKGEDLLKLGSYYLTRLAPAEALAVAGTALKSNPNSIDALLLKAKAEEASGDLKGALKTLGTAEEQWHAQGLDADEGPRYIRARMVQIGNKLRQGE